MLIIKPPFSLRWQERVQDKVLAQKPHHSHGLAQLGLYKKILNVGLCEINKFTSLSEACAIDLFIVVICE